LIADATEAIRPRLMRTVIAARYRIERRIWPIKVRGINEKITSVMIMITEVVAILHLKAVGLQHYLSTIL